MKLIDIQKKADGKYKRFGTYHIPDGIHQAIITDVTHKESTDRIYMKFELGDGTIFKCSADVADFAAAPLYLVIAPFIEEEGNILLEDIKDYAVQIKTKSRETKDGKTFSNIVDFEYLDNEESDD